jgi:cysteine-rich repeat protein
MQEATRWVLRGVATLSVTTLACASPLPNVGGESTSEGHSGSTSEMEVDATSTLSTSIATSDPPSTADGSTADGLDSTNSDSSTSTGPVCTPGEQGCTCDEGACNGTLLCVDDACVTCGNGEVDDGEECDDGSRTDSDGCDNDCTISAGAAQVIAGDEHVCALFHTGDIKCWGAFDSGRLGYLNQEQDVGDDETPADMTFVNLGAPVVQLALGSNFTCALLDTEDVKCWGSGQHGRLGQGSQVDFGIDEEPADIPAIDFGGGTPVHIAAGAEHA